MADSRRAVIEERLYPLLPAMYRIRDADQGEPLRALLAILEHELRAVRDDTQRLYDDWFIETCQEWVVPYIGDLLGATLMRSFDAPGFTARSFVANTLSYRRRKGTAASLEQLARDITGWPARAVEYFERLATTQHLQHVRLEAPASASLRGTARLSRLGGPLGDECHTAEVRSIASRRGLYNIPNIGLHLWRLQSYTLTGVDPYPVDEAKRRYYFNPIGLPEPLFNRPSPDAAFMTLAAEHELPVPLLRSALAEWLRQAETKDVAERVVTVRDVRNESPTSRLDSGVRTLKLNAEEGGADWPLADFSDDKVAHLDPEVGRLMVSPDYRGGPFVVDYSYGFSGDLGGGPYDRRADLRRDVDAPAGQETSAVEQHGVSKTEKAFGTEVIHATLGAAITAWNEAPEPGPHHRTIVVMDSRTYEEDLTEADDRQIVLGPDCTLRIVAARWPEVENPMTEKKSRVPGHFDPISVRPVLAGNLEIRVAAGARFELNGFLVNGSVKVLPFRREPERDVPDQQPQSHVPPKPTGRLAEFALRHCTLVPGKGGLGVETQADAGLEVVVARSIVDQVEVTGRIRKLRVSDSIVGTGPHRRTTEPERKKSDSRDAEPSSICAKETDVQIETSTLLGRVAVRSLEGSESLFVTGVHTRVTQDGCLRYCYAPADSRTPRRFRCQPELAVAAARAMSQPSATTPSEVDAQIDAVRARLRPHFTSVTYGHPAYCQLARTGPPELTTGASDGSEMGAFHMLHQAHREANLHAALEQYLRFGLEAGIFFVT